MSDGPFQPYRRLVEITVLGRAVRVPEKNTVLRCLQFLAPEAVAHGRFCWNNECGTCRFWARLPGRDEEERARGCRFEVVEGMRLTALSPELRRVLASFLAARPPDVEEIEETEIGPTDGEDLFPTPVFRKRRSDEDDDPA